MANENDSALSKSTNWVTVIATVANIVLVNLGLPIPVETLVTAGIAIQGAATLVARNRKAIMRRWGIR